VGERQYGVDGDTGAAEFFCGGLGEPDDAGLSRRINGLAQISMQSGIRRHVDDAAVLLGAEVWSTGADESECAAEVDVEHAVPCVVVHLPQHAVAKEPG